MHTLRGKVMVLNDIFSKKHSMTTIITMLIIATCGSFLQIAGTSWDVTSHIMQEPETFFTPSHTVLYAGVGLLTIAAGTSGFLLIRNNELRGRSFATPMKLLIIGSTISLAAGPSDFLWHEIFGVDGLLSPPHLALITGMLINAVATVVGLERIGVHVTSSSRQRLIKAAMVPAFAALWFTTIWYVYMFSLPFSDGENFQFNLNPNIASLIAIVTLPLLSSIIFLIASKSIGKFGAGTIVSALVVGTNIFANIVPSQGMMISILPWYFIIAILPALIADIILNNSTIKSKLGLRASELIAGILVSSVFYIFNYPMLTWAFAIPLDMPIANLQGMQAVASLTSNFLSTLPAMLSITLVPAALMGLLGALFVSKKITIPTFQKQQLQQPEFIRKKNEETNRIR
ncbi:MAG: hypothetical protein GEU26_14775 [Nitrososphaeraceae archaeon]|nr:hypothetical protein [Nitrososphaeraceae archaeon]